MQIVLAYPTAWGRLCHMKTNINATIETFNTNHIRAAAAKIAGKPLTTWSDGAVIVVAAGEGKDGEAVAAKIAAACRLPVMLKQSAILGSIAQLEAKAAAGITGQTFVMIAA